MKKVFILGMVLVALTMSAQGNRSERNGGRNDMSDLTPEQIADLKTKKMTLLLDLNENQQKEINKIHLKNLIERKERQQKSINKNDLSSEEKYQRRAMSLDHKIAFKNDMKSILDKEQFEEWEKRFARQRKNNKNRNHQKKRCL